MFKKTLISISIIFLVAFNCQASQKEAWQAYKTKFISNDGRVIDYFQKSISHSEGQGYGLLLALMYDDQETFDRLLKWSLDNLQIRRDALFAWAWGQRSNGAWMVIDYNNASDGDMLISFALVKAAKKWNHPPYMTLALEIIKDIRTLLAFHHDDFVRRCIRLGQGQGLRQVGGTRNGPRERDGVKFCTVSQLLERYPICE